MSIKNMSKANQRQNTKHKPAYDRYRNTAQREVNKLVGMLRHAKRQGFSTLLSLGANGGELVLPQKYDNNHAMRKAWSRCAERAGGIRARAIFNSFFA